MNLEKQCPAARAYDCLAAHGALTSYELAAHLGVSTFAVAAACGQLARAGLVIPMPGAAYRPVGQRARACHRWQINPHAPRPCIVDMPRCVVDRDKGIEPEDHEWMRHWREKHEQRIAAQRRRGVA